MPNGKVEFWQLKLFRAKHLTHYILIAKEGNPAGQSRVVPVFLKTVGRNGFVFYHVEL